MSWLRDLKFTDNGQHSIPNKPLKGRSVTIVGGGPSVTQDIVDAVHCGPIICANNSFMLVRKPVLVVALDRRWYLWHGQALQAAGHTAVTALRTGTNIQYRGAFYSMKKDREATYPTDSATLTGKNSGHAAIALAINLGARQIFLVGFDMGFIHGRTHYHEGHPVPSSEANYKTRFRPALEKLCVMSQAKGIHIASITPTLADIPVIELDNALKELRLENCMDNLTAPATLSL